MWKNLLLEPDKSRARTWPLPALLVICGAATLLFQGSRGLYETTEGRYAECAREIAQAGSWLEPVLNGQPHWTKPPLTYLSIRLPYEVLGATTWAARLYLVPCHLLAIAAVGWLALRLWRDRDSARMGALVFATSAIPMLASQTVSTDYPMAVSLALAQALFWESVRSRSRLAAHGVWLFMGLAFLAKGPPSLLVLPAMVAAWFRLPREERKAVPLFSPSALALFAFVGFGWYVWEAWKHPGLFDYWLRDEVVNRSLSDKFNRNPEFYKGFVIYLPVLLFGTLPWSGWLALRWRETWARLRMTGGLRAVWSGRSAEEVWRFFAVAFPLGVFMLSRSKLPLYLLPLFVPLAVAVGRLMLSVWGEDSRFRKRLSVTACAALSVFVVGKAVSTYVPSGSDMGALRDRLVARCGPDLCPQLALLNGRPLNGLSYYLGYEPVFLSLATLDGWLGEAGRSGRDSLVLADQYHVERIRAQLGARACEELKLSGKWRVLRIPAAKRDPAR